MQPFFIYRCRAQKPPTLIPEDCSVLRTPARAIYKNSPIILLDEPTSALDEQTEKIISKTISENHENTVIIIAHRLSTIKNVDRIYCMDKGEIVEVGNHEELIRKNGIYAALYGKEAHN